MQRLSGALSVLLLALQVMCSPAFADDADACVKAVADERIAACTRVIATGQGNLAWAYTNRGIAYQAKGDNDRAVADYTEAIRFDGRHARAYMSRGASPGRRAGARTSRECPRLETTSAHCQARRD